MRISILVGGAAALAAGAFAYYLTTQKGGAFRRDVQQRARESSMWLREQQRELHDGFDRIEDQIARLGDEMRERLDEIRRQASEAVQPQIDLENWTLERGDLQHDLRGLPRRS